METKTNKWEKINSEKIVCAKGREVEKMTLNILRETRKDAVPMNQEHNAISQGKFRE